MVAALTTRDEARYWSKIAIFHTTAAFDAPVRGSPSEYCCDVWCAKKLELCGYPTVKKIIFKIRLFVSTEYTNVTDRQTVRQSDGRIDTTQWHRPRRLCIALHGNKQQEGADCDVKYNNVCRWIIRRSPVNPSRRVAVMNLPATIHSRVETLPFSRPTPSKVCPQPQLL